mmetsp:Transcript_2327/g.5478  ORF Transcript_2327/g.5478 Transcript_2327/m.5478 type:complete len:239 (-) Transcript_2327:574-1290(-)
MSDEIAFFCTRPLLPRALPHPMNCLLGLPQAAPRKVRQESERDPCLVHLRSCTAQPRCQQQSPQIQCQQQTQVLPHIPMQFPAHSCCESGDPPLGPEAHLPPPALQHPRTPRVLPQAPNFRMVFWRIILIFARPSLLLSFRKPFLMLAMASLADALPRRALRRALAIRAIERLVQLARLVVRPTWAHAGVVDAWDTGWMIGPVESNRRLGPDDAARCSVSESNSAASSRRRRTTSLDA